MPTPMSPEAIDAFLRGSRLGVLAINRKGKPPQQVVAWFRYDGKTVWIPSEKGVAKVGNLFKDDQVSFCVDDRRMPHKGVVVYGRAELVEENVDELRATVIRHALRGVLPLEEIEAMAAEPRPLGKVMIKLVPEHIYSWDYGTTEQGWARLRGEYR